MSDEHRELPVTGPMPAQTLEELDRRVAREILRLNEEIDELRQKFDTLHRVLRRVEAETRNMRR